MAPFKKIEVPQGNYISWGKKGQQVTIDVLSFDPVGGEDFNGNTCPMVIGYLTEDCDNYRDRGATHERLTAGTLVNINGGTANLKKGLLICDPKRGDLLRMTFSDTYETDKGPGKVIEVEHAPGAGGGSNASNGGDDDDDDI